ncbi:hypothetical protein NE865_16237 [Phthorimaea operculella]|nr:hypothetical protein NE865_16237 [Phthorimaea operculella]
MQNDNELLCFGCQSPIADNLFLCCCVCSQKYDLVCANVPEERFNGEMTKKHKLSWKCVCCNTQYVPKSDLTPATPSSFGVNTNSRRGASKNTPMSPLNFKPSDPVGSQRLQVNVDSDTIEMATELRKFRQQFVEEMQASRTQLAQLNESFSKFVSRVEICESKIDSLTDRIETIERRMAEREAAKPETSQAIDELKAELNRRDQEQLMNDMEISRIPEQQNENLLHIAITLAKKVPTQEDRPPRPRPIVVRLARRTVRDQLLKAARVRRGATTEGTDLPGPPRRFYFNERLTRTNRQLFQRARELGGQQHWKYIWTRDGKVFARKNSSGDSPRCRIRMEADLARIFGSDTV